MTTALKLGRSAASPIDVELVETEFEAVCGRREACSSQRLPGGLKHRCEAGVGVPRWSCFIIFKAPSVANS